MTYEAHYNAFSKSPFMKIAIIYSLDDLFAYAIEIKKGETSYYISDRNKCPLKFYNMEDARKAALHEKVDQAYLALSKTYEENDLSTCHANQPERFDYTSIPLLKK